MVFDTDAHVVRCRRSTKGLPMSVSYNHMRIASKSEFVKHLKTGSFRKVRNARPVTYTTQPPVIILMVY